MGVWAPLIPFAKSRANLDEAQLGLLLLCLGAGSLTTMPLTGMIASRVGCRRAIVIPVLLFCAAMPALGSLSNPFALGFALFLFGAGIGSADVAMNLQAAIVEKASGRALMSGFHGMYSVGGIAGAGFSTGILSLKAGPPLVTILAAVIMVVLLAASFRYLLTDKSHESGPAFVWPRGSIVVIGAVCFVAFMAEGAILDWSAEFLRSAKSVDLSHAGWGYAAFAVTMSIGRLYGDAISQRFSSSGLLVIGAFLAAGSLIGVVLSPSGELAVLCCALTGIGLSNFAPILFRQAASTDAMPAGLAIATITTMGYGGLLLGPATIGFVAKSLSLGTALLGLAVIVFISGLTASRLPSK